MQQVPNPHLDSSHGAFLFFKLISALLLQGFCMGKASILGYFPEMAAWFKHHYLGDTFFDPGPA